VLYRDDEATLAQQYEWMMLFLERTDTIQPLEKGKIEERLAMYDQLWEESPRVQKMKVRLSEEADKKAEQKKKEEEQKKKERAEVEVKVLRQALLGLIHGRFPDLSEFAQKQVGLFDDPAVLNLLIRKIAAAPDANTARWLLDLSTKAPE
jgi:hypothetical protein